MTHTRFVPADFAAVGEEATKEKEAQHGNQG